ncbi:MAG TPA: NADH-quinone oxidoreductase subunit J [Solirubrobacteraceae bacterium]|nr:NADH-quinone oxidoreductase subunit J [Solirubrobacteraceae bacterium]
MSAVLFFIAAIGVISGAVGVVVLRNPFYSVLALVAHLLSLAVLFLLLRSEFVAAVQVVVYAGAVMVLYVFVVAYVGGEGESVGERLHGAGRGPAGSQLRLGGAILGGALLVELLIALLGTGLEATSGYGAGYVPGPQTYGTPAYIGKLLLTRFLLAFELASFLLLIAAVGGVVLARRRGGIGEADASSPEGEHETFVPLDLLRPRGTGTTAEGVGAVLGNGNGRHPHADQAPRSHSETGAEQPS